MYHYSSVDLELPYIVCGGKDPWNLAEPPLPEYFVRYNKDFLVDGFSARDACNCGWAFPPPLNDRTALQQLSPPTNMVIYFEEGASGCNDNPSHLTTTLVVSAISIYLSLLGCTCLVWSSRQRRRVLQQNQMRRLQRGGGGAAGSMRESQSIDNDNTNQSIPYDPVRSRRLVLSALFPDQYQVSC